MSEAQHSYRQEKQLAALGHARSSHWPFCVFQVLVAGLARGDSGATRSVDARKVAAADVAGAAEVVLRTASQVFESASRVRSGAVEGSAALAVENAAADFVVQSLVASRFPWKRRPACTG